MVFKVPYSVKVFSPSSKGEEKNCILWQIDEINYDFSLGLYFELVSPSLPEGERTKLCSSLWGEFTKVYKETSDFDKALQKAIAALQKTLHELNLAEGIDANFVLFSLERAPDVQGASIEAEQRIMKLAVIGELDIVLIRKGKYSNLAEYIPKQIDLSKIEYHELDIFYNDVILVSSKGVLINAIESGMLDLEGIPSLISSLERFKSTMLDDKRVFLMVFSDFNPNAVSNNVVKGKTKNNLKPAVIVSLLATTRNKFGNVLKNLSKLSTLLKKTKALNNRLDSKVAPIYFGQTEEGVDSGIKKPGVTALMSQREEVVNIDISNNTGGVSQIQRQTEMRPEAQREVTDPVEYLKRRNSLEAKVSRYIGKLTGLVNGGRKGSYRESKGPFRTGRALSTNYSRFSFLAGIGLIVLFVLGVRWNIRRKAIKHDQAVIEEFKQKYFDKLGSVYNSVMKLVADDPNGDIQKCVDLAKQLKDAAATYKVNLKTKDTEKQIEEYVTKADKISKECKQKYYEVYNITKLSSLNLLKDLKISLGSDSQPYDIDIYKGEIAVLDIGKKAVYKVNKESGDLTVLEDPDNLLEEPNSLAIGNETVFVCDKKNGILYYDTKAKRIKPIKTTHPDVLGENCTQIDTFGKNVYFLTEAGNVLYKVVGLGGLRYASPVKYITYEEGSLIDLAIDGSIYFLAQRATVSGYDVIRFYGGKFDPSFTISEQDLKRFKNLTGIFTNPSGNFPVYVYDEALNTIFVIEKPTKEKHPGKGVIVGTYELPDAEKKADSLAVELSVVTNRETKIYLLIDGALKYFNME